MTIEKEAEDCVYPDNNPMDAFWKSICDEHPCIGEELESIRFRIHKALQKKQDRIEELSLRDVNIRENLILNLDEDMSKLRELSTEQLVCKAVTGIFWRDKDIKNLNKRIETLENELRAYDLDIYGADGAKEISNMRKRIKTLESALKEVATADDNHTKRIRND